MSRTKKLNGWRKTIAEAKLRGRFLERDVDRSESWNSCAVGEARRVFKGRPDLKKMIVSNSGVPTYTLSCPGLSKVETLGTRFCAAVYANKFDRALQILKRIEAGK